jgi:hypothetical protein
MSTTADKESQIKNLLHFCNRTGEIQLNSAQTPPSSSSLFPSVALSSVFPVSSGL